MSMSMQPTSSGPPGSSESGPLTHELLISQHPGRDRPPYRGRPSRPTDDHNQTRASKSNRRPARAVDRLARSGEADQLRAAAGLARGAARRPDDRPDRAVGADGRDAEDEVRGPEDPVRGTGGAVAREQVAAARDVDGAVGADGVGGRGLELAFA